MRAAATDNWDTKYCKGEKDLKNEFLFVLLRKYLQKAGMTIVRSLSKSAKNIRIVSRSPSPGYLLVRHTKSVFEVLMITLLITTYAQFLKNTISIK